MKRCYDHTVDETPVADHPITKRTKLSNHDRLSHLSDELLLRVLSFLSIHDLNNSQRISGRFKSLAADSQLWKALYYNHYVRPRASRIPGMKEVERVTGHLTYSSKLSKWLDEESLVKGGKQTNWKRQYKLRHNWSRGACDIDEIQVADESLLPPILVRMHEDLVYTVDTVGGLRCWRAKKQRGLLAKVDLSVASPPTALAVDSGSRSEEFHRIAVGFEDGSYSLYELDRRKAELTLLYRHPASSNGMLSAIALYYPYVVTMTASQLLSLYQLPEDNAARSAPRLLHSLRSHTTWPPLSLAIRTSSQNIIATIAYALPTFTSGWAVGVQEIWLTSEGDLLESRLATSNAEPRGLSSSPPSSLSSRTSSPSPYFAAATPGYSKPTSLSYSHPYLLLSHPDNTLTLYMVTSTDRSLEISSGSRLWGHTSSVSGAHVGGRGKAVSVSSRGDELRIWELEGNAKRRMTSSEMSVRVQSSPSRQVNDDGSVGMSTMLSRRALGTPYGMRTGRVAAEDLGIVRGWVGFDDENVVILREKVAGSQALVVYDFT